jgi:enamine deaminase RidA (YjgF/YER057c/UK114 family)
VGREVTIEEGYAAAKLTGLNLLAVIKAELGDLDRVAAFVKTLGFVNSAPGFTEQPAVLNGFADLILDLYGAERGLHARSAVGMAELPWDIPVEIETIVAIAP